MKFCTSRFLAAAACVAALFVPTYAAGHTLLEDDSLKLDVNGWTEAGYLVRENLDGEFEHGPYISLARLAAGAVHKPWGRAFVQFEGADGDVQLLDLIAELRPSEALTLRVGKFKVPTSAEFMISAAQKPFVNRAMLVGFVQRRLIGAELVSTLETNSLVATAQAGWFQASPQQRALLPGGDGNFVSIRGLVELPNGLGFHLAYLSLVLADNDPVVPPDDPAADPLRPVDLPELADAAIMYVGNDWQVYLEGLVAPVADEELPWAAYLHVLHLFDIGESFGLEPGGRYGVTSREGILTHRATAGLTLYLVGVRLATNTNYELTVREGDVGHAGYLQMQAGF